MEPKKAQLGMLTAALLVGASMVGTGVFTTSGYLVAGVGQEGAAFWAWLVGGIVALFGALAYAELGAAIPENGGEYRLLTRIYHPALGFAAGVTSIVFGFAAPIAGAAIAFGTYFNRASVGFFGAGAWTLPEELLAASVVVAASVIHAGRVSRGVQVQNVATLVKLVLLLIVAVVGLVLASGGSMSETESGSVLSGLSSPGLAVGLVFVYYAYTGWNAASYIAGEVRDAERNLPRALLLGTVFVTVLYLAINATLLLALDLEQLKSAQEDVSHLAATALIGETGGAFVSAMIALGLLSTVGAMVMGGARVYGAMADDYPALRWFRSTAAGRRRGLVVQGCIAVAFILTATHKEIVNYVGFTLSIFAALTVVGVLVLRVREPELSRPYRAWGAPVTPVLFAIMMLWTVLHSLNSSPAASLFALGAVGVFGLGYLFVRRRGSRSSDGG